MTLANFISGPRSGLSKSFPASHFTESPAVTIKQTSSSGGLVVTPTLDFWYHPLLLPGLYSLSHGFNQELKAYLLV